MTNTTKNTTTTSNTAKSIFLALSVALTMGVASATTVPGIPGDVFEFSKPGVGSGAVVGTGVDAVANINAILDAVQGTGGSNIDNGAFWGSAVSETKTAIFEYTAAKPMIDELIFTVTGQAYGLKSGSGVGWHDAGEVIDTVTGETLKSQFLAKGSNIKDSNQVSIGSYVDGKLSLTSDKAIHLMTTLLGFSVDETKLTTALADGSDDPTAFGGPLPTEHVAAKAIDGSITTAVGEAGINRAGFNNANQLIALIADQLKTGYILDVDKATTNLEALADHHTGFLGASLVSEAHGIKAMIRAIGYQEAAAGIGIGAQAACTSGTAIDKEQPACVAIGQEFKDMISKIPALAASDTMVDDYEAALVNINTFANNIISFNNTVNGFDPATEAALINAQFGTITVKIDETDDNVDNTLYEHLEAGTGPTVADWTSESLFEVEDFDSALTFTDLGDDNAIGGVDIVDGAQNADTTETVHLR